jgi:hypothetical protein
MNVFYQLLEIGERNIAVVPKAFIRGRLGRCGGRISFTLANLFW